MAKVRFLVGIAVLLGLLETGFADVVFDPEFRFEDLIITSKIEPSDSNLYHHIKLIGCDLATVEIGKPLLPVYFLSLLIPPDEDVDGITVDSIISTKVDIAGEYWVYPAQPPVYLGGTPEFAPPDSETYTSNLPYPGELVKVGWVGYRSGYKIVNLLIYPVQFTPAQKKLELWTNICFTLRTKAGINLAVPVYRRSEQSQRIIEAYIKSLVENPEDVRGAEGDPHQAEQRAKEAKPLEITFLPSIEGEFVDYVIITNETLKDTFQMFADWKTKKGVVTQVRTVECIDQNYWGCDLQEKIRCFITDAYKYWGTIWVLFGGDVELVSDRKANFDTHLLNWGPTDLYFSGLDGNWNANGNYQFGEADDDCDYFPDLFIGRASIEDEKEASIFVRKVLTYEKNPPTDYLTNMLLLGASISPYHLPDTTWHYDGWGAAAKETLQLAYPVGASIPWWFTIYELYGPRVDPIPPIEWEGDDELTAANAIAALNSGYHLINHADHCDYYNMGMGRETGGGFLFRDDAMNLTNGPRYFILWTLGCAPNAFDNKSISEAVLNCENGGAVAYVGNTRTAWVTNTIKKQDLEFFRTLFVDSLYNLGILLASTQNPDSFWTYECANMNLLGDPEMPVWTNTPQNLIVSHPDTFWLPESIFTVKVTGMSDGDTALVCVQKETEVYGYGTIGYPDSTIDFTIKPHTPGYLNVTVTCHNYFVYEDSCYIPQYAFFAWLYPYSYFIFDDSLQTYGRVKGNKDGISNPGELVQLYIDIGNSGAHTGYYVTATLRSNDTLIRITSDSVVYYGHILPGDIAHKDTLSHDGYFGFYLKPDYPDTVLDYHRIHFEIFIEAFRTEGNVKNPSRHPQEWTYSLILTEFCDSLGHSGHRLVPTPEEPIYELYPEITNFGGGSAKGVVAILRGVPSFNIQDSVSYFGEIKSGKTKFNEQDPFVFRLPMTDLNIVMHDYYDREWIEPVFIDTIPAPDSVWANPDERAIEICWDYVNIPKPPTLAGYNIYRSENGVMFRRVNSVLITNVSLYHDVGLLDWFDYYYWITAVDTFGNESDFSPMIAQRTYPPYQQGFPAEVVIGWGGLGFYYSSLAVGDIDSDGKDEIAVGAQGNVYLFDDNGTVMQDWPVYIGDLPINSSPALTDLNNDDTLEIIIGTGSWWGGGDNCVHCLNIHGQEMPGWPALVSAQVYASPVIADIDGDGQDEILAVTMAPDASLYAWEADGGTVPGFPVTGDATLIPQSPAVADFDNDGREEIFLQSRGSPTGNLCLLKYNPSLGQVDTMPGWPQLPDVTFNVWPTHPLICDIDNDNTLEIIGSIIGTGSIYCFEYDGTLNWQFTFDNPSNIEQISGAGLGDIDLDGNIEILFVVYEATPPYKKYVYAVNSAGNRLWKSEFPMAGTYAKSSQGAVIGDIDGDIYPEILFSDKEHLWVLKHDGSVMRGAPFRLECDGHSTPAITDLDRDGDVEVVCASGGDCELKVWDIPTPYIGSEWPMLQHDRKHTGRYYYIDEVPPIVRIISPLDGAYLTPSDSLPIFGTALDANFAKYQLKYRPFLSPSQQWYPVEPDSYSTTPVDSGLLGYWNTIGFSGRYYLCLVVSDSFNNIAADTIAVFFLLGEETPPIIDPEFATFSSRPIDVATDVLNCVYVTDTGNDKIWKFSENGDSLLAFSYDFKKPKGVAVDDSFFIWVTDCLNHCVKKLDSLGNFIFKFGKHGNDPGEFNQPTGIAIDGSGYLWICDNKNDRVQKFDRWGNFILQIPDTRRQMTGSRWQIEDSGYQIRDKRDRMQDGRYKMSGIKDKMEEGEIALKQPTGVSVLEGIVFITDNKNNRVVVFDTAGNYIRTIGELEGLKLPWDNQVDCFGNLFVADVHNHRIVEFNPWGYQLLAFGVKGDKPGQFKLPHGVALSRDGKYLYVCDTYNNRVQKFLMYLEPEQKYTGGPQGDESQLLRPFFFEQIYPNPIKGILKIRFNSPDERIVTVKIYDVVGRLAEKVFDGKAKIGMNEFLIVPKELSAGVYFVRLKTEGYTKTEKVILLR